MDLRRYLEDPIREDLAEKLVLLAGPRQVGKTTLLKMLQDYAERKNYQTASFDLEQPQVLADFILLKDRRPIPIEVKARVSSQEIPKGLRIFIHRYKNIKKAYVVNENRQEIVHYDSCFIHFIKFEDFENMDVQSLFGEK